MDEKIYDSCPQLCGRQNGGVNLIVPHDRKDNCSHFFGHITDDVRIAQSLCKILFIIGLKHGIVLYCNRASYSGAPIRQCHQFDKQQNELRGRKESRIKAWRLAPPRRFTPSRSAGRGDGKWEF